MPTALADAWPGRRRALFARRRHRRPGGCHRPPGLGGPVSERANADDGSRDPAPCVYAAGRLYVAPADADRVFCLDAATGAPLWSSGPLSTSPTCSAWPAGRVVCSARRLPRGLVRPRRRARANACRTGATASPGPTRWPRSAAACCSAIASTGRHGPAACRNCAGTARPAMRRPRFATCPAATWHTASGCLVVATADRLHVLVGDDGMRAAPRPSGRAGTRTGGTTCCSGGPSYCSRAGRPAAEVRAVFDAAAGPQFPPERRFLALVRRVEFEQAGW